MGVIARVGIYGDIHLSSKGYGGHTDYSNESLKYYETITEIMERNEVTHIIGLGDLTFGKFNDLDYRDTVDKLLDRQLKLTSGNKWEIKGNHDASSKGKTEYEYYLEKGKFKGAENITIGNMHITMINYGKEKEVKMNISDDESAFNIVCSHGYYKFKDSQLPNFGEALELDEFSKFYGVDYFVLGHIHHIMQFGGNIIKDNTAHRAIIDYMGCPSRPAYTPDNLDNVGRVLIFEVNDDGVINRIDEEFELLPVNESFNLEQREEDAEHKEMIHVDISDVVESLNNHERAIGNPEDVINGLQGVKEEYKKKAIELLFEADK